VAEDDDIYTYGSVPEKNIEYGKVIKSGKFAKIFKIRLITGNESQPAVAKVLKNGFNKGDVELMKQKIDMLKSEVPAHVNIVRYIGDVQDDVTNGPVLLLEYCEKTLSDWLKEIRTVDADVLESMLGFSLNIAAGMEHLHTHNIVHRRLAARNVLLKRSRGGYTAKLIGFGPSDGDTETKKVPVKWLAPETLQTLSTGVIYNQKTDVWSFGIIMQEIYSKGGDLYPDTSSENLLSFLNSGQRMQRAKYMPDELYKTVVIPSWSADPTNRPSFPQIRSRLDEFRMADAGNQEDYYDPGVLAADPNRAASAAGYLQARDNGHDNDYQDFYDDAK
jgi:serine/threonine protein kinase